MTTVEHLEKALSALLKSFASAEANGAGPMVIGPIRKAIYRVQRAIDVIEGRV